MGGRVAIPRSWELDAVVLPCCSPRSAKRKLTSAAAALRAAKAKVKRYC